MKKPWGCFRRDGAITSRLEKMEPQEPPQNLSPPDLTGRPYKVRTERIMQVRAEDIFAAFTSELDQWFAVPGSLLMRVEENTPFFFETSHQAEEQALVERHPHYGRFLQLVSGKLVRMTWMTSQNDMGGVETVLTIELEALGNATTVRLTHEGFAEEAMADQHAKAWPFVLAQLEARFG